MYIFIQTKIKIVFKNISSLCSCVYLKLAVNPEIQKLYITERERKRLSFYKYLLIQNPYITNLVQIMNNKHW